MKIEEYAAVLLQKQSDGNENGGGDNQEESFFDIWLNRKMEASSSRKASEKPEESEQYHWRCLTCGFYCIKSRAPEFCPDCSGPKSGFLKSAVQSGN